tara:strand:+ start:417 stop:794 length:378 start_codon:yes stop_codon:yes gene_type:complete
MIISANNFSLLLNRVEVDHLLRMSGDPAGRPGGTSVIEKQKERVIHKSPKYKVFLHNDPINPMDYVVAVLREVVPQLSEEDAMAIMLEAHNTGLGLVIVCDLEPAEFYSESLKAKGLTSTIELDG